MLDGISAASLRASHGIPMCDLSTTEDFELVYRGGRGDVVSLLCNTVVEASKAISTSSFCSCVFGRVFC